MLGLKSIHVSKRAPWSLWGSPPVDFPHKIVVIGTAFPCFGFIIFTKLSVGSYQIRNKRMLGRVPPLGWPRSVYKRYIECHFLEFWVEMANWSWRSRSMTPIFNTSGNNLKVHYGLNFINAAGIHYKLLRGQAIFLKILGQNGQNDQNDLEGPGQWPPFSIPAASIPSCMFSANLMIVSQIYFKSLCGQVDFPRGLSQNGHNDLEGQGQWPPFSIPAAVSQDACFMQIWWF